MHEVVCKGKYLNVNFYPHFELEWQIWKESFQMKWSCTAKASQCTIILMGDLGRITSKDAFRKSGGCEHLPRAEHLEFFFQTSGRHYTSKIKIEILRWLILEYHQGGLETYHWSQMRKWFGSDILTRVTKATHQVRQVPIILEHCRINRAFGCLLVKTWERILCLQYFQRLLEQLLLCLCLSQSNDPLNLPLLDAPLPLGFPSLCIFLAWKLNFKKKIFQLFFRSYLNKKKITSRHPEKSTLLAPLLYQLADCPSWQ